MPAWSTERFAPCRADRGGREPSRLDSRGERSRRLRSIGASRELLLTIFYLRTAGQNLKRATPTSRRIRSAPWTLRRCLWSLPPARRRRRPRPWRSASTPPWSFAAVSRTSASSCIPVCNTSPGCRRGYRSFRQSSDEASTGTAKPTFTRSTTTIVLTALMFGFV